MCLSFLRPRAILLVANNCTVKLVLSQFFPFSHHKLITCTSRERPMCVSQQCVSLCRWLKGHQRGMTRDPFTTVTPVMNPAFIPHGCKREILYFSSCCVILTFRVVVFSQCYWHTACFFCFFTASKKVFDVSQHPEQSIQFYFYSRPWRAQEKLLKKTLLTGEKMSGSAAERGMSLPQRDRPAISAAWTDNESTRVGIMEENLTANRVHPVFCVWIGDVANTTLFDTGERCTFL